jgi:hypothetical protein
MYKRNDLDNLIFEEIVLPARQQLENESSSIMKRKFINPAVHCLVF